MFNLSLQNKYIVFVFIAVIIAIAFYSYIPALFSIDDTSYFLMAKSFSDSFSYEVWSGFKDWDGPESYKAAAYGMGQYVYFEKSMYVKYPPYYPLVAYPFYKLFNIRGLFFLNIISFGGSLYLIYLIALKLFSDRRLAARSVYLYALSTFAMEYAMGLWPHMLSVFLVIAGLYMFLMYFLPENGKYVYLVLSSMVLSFSIGIRLLNVMYLAVAFLLILFFQRNKGHSILFILMSAPLIIIQGIINLFRFGRFDPFSYGYRYGRNFSYYFLHPEFLILFAFLVFIFFLAVKKKKVFTAKISFYTAGVVLISMFFVISLNSNFRAVVYYWLYTLYCNIVDMSKFVYNTVTLKDESGTISYGGVVKKALLQSCPFLILSFVSVFFMLREKVTKKVVFFVYSFFIIPIIFISSFFFHGGFAYNIRYGLEFIPFAIIAFCWLIRDISFKQAEILTAGIISVPFLLMFYYQKGNSSAVKSLVLYIPLIFSLILIICFLYSTKRGSKNRYLHLACNLMLLVTMFYGFCAGWIGDVLSSRRVREENYLFYNSLNSLVENDSFICTVSNTSVQMTPIKALKKIRLAYISVEYLDIYDGLIRFFLARNIPSYVVALEEDRNKIETFFAKKFVLKKVSDANPLLYRISERPITLR